MYLNDLKLGEINKEIIKSNDYLAHNLMTLIIGVRCIDGVVLAGDRRLMRGNELSEEKKITETIFPSLIVGYSGVTSIMDKFLSNLEKDLVTGKENKTWEDIRHSLEDSVARLRTRYSQRVREYSFEVLYCFRMDDDHVNLFRIYDTGIDEERKTFDAIGIGAPHALPFLKAAYDPEITMEKAVWLCTFILQLIDKCNINIYVGGKPQIFKIPDIGDPVEMPDEEIDNLLEQMQVIEKLKAAIFN